MYSLYSFIYLIAIIVLLPFEYLKRPREIRRKWLREKFGLIKEVKGEIIWIHAVSVGEVIAATPLIKRIKERYPSKSIVVSTITDTGQKVAKERSPDGTTILYLPFDMPSILKRVLNKVKPELLIVIETEIWPNLIRVFKENGIPVLLLNGRISENSFRGYRKVAFFMKRVLSPVDFFGMQGEEYADRIKRLGVDGKKVRTLGNFKFDTKPPGNIPAWTEKIGGQIITAGSTHDGEEELITEVYLALKKEFPELNLIIAPRHPERFKTVEDMLKSKGVSFVKRSEIDGVNGPSLKGAIILLDTVGELSSVYGISDIAIIGKSFRGLGGQNPLEPAYWSKPIVCGPHMENFPVVQEFYREGAALETKEEELYAKIKDLLLSPEKAKVIGSKAREVFGKNSGAVERAMEVIEGYIAYPGAVDLNQMMSNGKNPLSA
jgi:3-deoxy-D-manno-octulosonic-acid transferase